MLGLVLAVLSGCALSAHTIPPYSIDIDQARALEERAGRECSAATQKPSPVITRFATDGCTLYPDNGWASCCITHDIDYWCGGSREARLESDRKLRRCVEASGHGVQARLMYWGVRFGGHPVIPHPWRWGYGRGWPSGYDD